MSQSNIYESNWINLVFEHRNKEYGAYQLRQENTKTSLIALLLSVSLCTGLFTAPKLFSLLDHSTTKPTDINCPIVTPLHVVEVNVTPTKPKTPKTTETTAKQQVVTQITKTPTFANPIIVQSNQATEEIPTNETIQNSITTNSNAILGTQGSPGTGTSPVSTTNPTSIDYGNEVVNTAILDKQPSFPGGMEKFYNYIGKNFESPEINEEKTIRFFVSFIVEKDGSMTNIHIKTDPGYNLSKEAIRVLESIKTKWSPGIINSKPVRTTYNLPITIQMN